MATLNFVSLFDHMHLGKDHEFITSCLQDNPNTRRPNKHLYIFIKQQKSDSREINSLKSNGINYTLPTDKDNILNT